MIKVPSDKEESEELDMTEHAPIRTALAGFGLSGKVFHAPFIDADPHFALKKVYERSSAHSREEYPEVEVVHNFEELLTNDIDLVVICTPNLLHVPMARQALEAGKHVVVEKPVAPASREAESLCRLAEEKGVIFTVYQNRRLDGDFLTVKKLIQAGRLGEVVDYECHFDRFIQGYRAKQWKVDGGKGVDLLYDIGVHIIDQAVTLFGLPEEVYADLRHQRPESSGVDKFEVTLYYPGRRAILSAGKLVAMQGPRYMVHGRQGAFLKYGADAQERRLTQGLRPAGNPDWGRDDPKNYGTLYTAGADGQISAETIPTEVGNYSGFYDNLYRAIRREAPLLVKPEEAVAVLRILEAAQESAQQKRRIRPDR